MDGAKNMWTVKSVIPNKELLMVVVYGFGKEPMMLLTNLKSTKKRSISLVVTKVYLLRIEEYFRFKKQQFAFGDIRVWSLKSIQNFNLLRTLAVGYVGIMTCEKAGTLFLVELKKCSKKIYDIPQFIFYALGYAIENVLVKTNVGIQNFIQKKVKSQQLDIFKYFKLAVP